MEIPPDIGSNTYINIFSKFRSPRMWISVPDRHTWQDETTIAYFCSRIDDDTDSSV